MKLSLGRCLISVFMVDRGGLLHCFREECDSDLFKKYFIFDCRIINLQYCDGFCHIST